MKRYWRTLWVGLLTTSLLLSCLFHPTVLADAPELTITQLNITGDEYVTIQNTGVTAVDLSRYWLGYSSSDTATAGPGQQLAAVILQAEETIVLNNGTAPTCGAVAVDTLDFSLSNTAGTLMLWRLDTAGGATSFAFLSAVSWGKSTTGNSYLKIAEESNVTKYNPTNPVPSWLRGSTTWQVGDFHNCQFTPVVSATTGGPTQIVDWPTSDETPPFSVLSSVSVSTTGGEGASIPASNIGLKPPVLSELLPNPATPATDAEDEFIELYNPNSKEFDLSGFKLQIASTTTSTIRSYTIPNGTKLAAKSFKAFMSADTNLALNNTAGQVWFVDPLDRTISTSGLYSGVKEGVSLINTNGNWQWTLAPTPGAANKLQAPLSASASKKKASVNGRAITGLSSVSNGTQVAGANSNLNENQAIAAVPIHTGTLVAVAIIALLYLAYEYRRDVANKINQLREYRANRS